jgi:hypothetical protein
VSGIIHEARQHLLAAADRSGPALSAKAAVAVTEIVEINAKVDVLEDLRDRMNKLPNYTAGLLTYTGLYGQGYDAAVADVLDVMAKVVKEHAKIKEPVGAA